MTLDAVLIGDPGGQSRMEKFFFREILAGSLELHNVAVGTPTSPLSDFTLPRGPGLPEVASSTHLAVVVKGQAFLWRSKQEFLDIEYGLPRFVGPAGLEGMKNSAVVAIMLFSTLTGKWGWHLSLPQLSPAICRSPGFVTKPRCARSFSRAKGFPRWQTEHPRTETGWKEKGPYGDGGNTHSHLPVFPGRDF